MNCVVVNKQNVSLKEYNGQRVVTFKDIDRVHERPEGTARKRFNDNKRHFVEGTDYYRIQPSEIRTVGISSPNGGIVVTQSGYLMLVKSFTDELSWQIQRELVNSYFTKTKPYEFIPKTFRGQSVITLDDFVYFVGVNRYTVRYYIAHGNLVNRTDYFLIEHSDLVDFKRENPRCNKYANSLYLITKSGFVKLLKLLGIQVKMPECFTLAPAKEIVPVQLPLVNFKWKTEQVVDVPENPQFQKLLSKVKQDMTAISLLLEQINKFHKEEDFRHYGYVIHQLAFDIATETGDMQRFKPNIVEKAI